MKVASEESRRWLWSDPLGKKYMSDGSYAQFCLHRDRILWVYDWQSEGSIVLIIKRLFVFVFSWLPPAGGYILWYMDVFAGTFYLVQVGQVS